MKVGDLVTASHWDGVIAMVVNTGRLTTTGIVRVMITVSGETSEVDQLAQDLEVI
tara:strand:- start:442 stop:606 length:165 start_codon:yes stop_codon:yes gene_type:complete